MGQLEGSSCLKWQKHSESYIESVGADTVRLYIYPGGWCRVSGLAVLSSRIHLASLRQLVSSPTSPSADEYHVGH